jgi:hypothetical protein
MGAATAEAAKLETIANEKCILCMWREY